MTQLRFDVGPASLGFDADFLGCSCHERLIVEFRANPLRNALKPALLGLKPSTLQSKMKRLGIMIRKVTT